MSDKIALIFIRLARRFTSNGFVCDFLDEAEIVQLAQVEQIR